MLKKRIAGVLVVVVLIAGAVYWFRGYERGAEPPLTAMPPAQALGFIAIPGLPQAWSDLRQTQFFQRISSPAFWQRALGPEGYQRVIDARRDLEQQLGFPLTEQTVGPLLAREFGLALVPRQGNMRPLDVIVYARVSATEKVIESLTRTFSQPSQTLVRDTQRVDNTDIFTLRPKGAATGLSYAFIGSLAVLSTDPAWVIDALKAHQGAAGERLHTNRIIRDMQVENAASLLAYAYYDAEGVQAQVMGGKLLGKDIASPAALRMLQTTSKISMKATRTPEGVKVETMALYPHNGVPQMFRRPEQGVTPLFSGVPGETFFLTHIDILDLQGLWKLIKELAAMGPQDALVQALDQFRQRTGVDVEVDVLATFTGAFGLGITGPFGPQGGYTIPIPGLFLILGITDEQKAGQLIETVGTKMAGPYFQRFFKKTVHDGNEILHLATPLVFIKPGYVITRKHLILGSDVSLLQHMLDAASGKTRTLAQTDAFKEMLKQFRINGGTMTFVDVGTGLDKAREWWERLGFLTKALGQFDTRKIPEELTRADFWTLTDLIRPIRYIGSISQGEAQGVRTESFIALDDLK